MTENRSLPLKLSAPPNTRRALIGLAFLLLGVGWPAQAQTISYTEFHTGPALPVLTGGGPGTWDEFIREKVQVRQDGTGFRMWYVGHSAEGQSTSKIGYATSPDGVTWTRHPGNPIISRDGLKDQDLSVGTFPDGTYWMYIEVNDAWIDLLTSSDGISWAASTANPVKTSAASPVVWREGSSWFMLYEYMVGPIFNINLATSSDGRIWTDSPANPVIAESIFTAPDTVLKEGTTYHLYYHNGNNGTWHATSSNLTSWTQRKRVLEHVTSPAVIRTTSGELWCYLWEHDGTLGPSRYYLRRGVPLQYPLVWSLNDGAGAVATGLGDQVHGALRNGPVWTTGIKGGGLAFDGSNDFVETEFIANLSAWTIATWVRGDSVPVSGPASGPINRGNAFQFNWDHADPQFRGAAAVSVNSEWYAASFGPLSAQTWYHLAATYDGETLRAYTNGVLISTNVSPSGPPTEELSRLVLGRHTSADHYFGGVVDDVRIYDRPLDAAAITVLSSLDPDTTGPTTTTLAGAVAGQTVNLSWTAASDPETGIARYRVYRGVSSGSGKPLLAEVNGFELSYIDDGAANTAYYYHVTAVNGGGLESAASNQVEVVTGNVPPAAPSGLTAAVAGGDVALDWADSREVDFELYRVYRRTNTGGTYELLGWPVTSAFSDTGLEQGNTYFYVVTAVDGSGLESMASAEVTATVLSTVAGLRARWDLNEGAGTIASDTAGGADGLLVNGPAWTNGPIGGALVLDGLNDYVSTPFMLHVPEWTVATWVWSPAAPANAPVSGPLQSEANFQINWNHPDSTFRGAASLRVGGNWYAARFGTLAGGTWYHLAATYDGETLRSYRDGVLITTNAAPSGPASADAQPLLLGRHATRDQYFAGIIAGVRIYDRPLEGAAIAQLSAPNPDTTPPGPTTLSATVAGQSVNLSWTASADPESGVGRYRVYRGTTSTGGPLLAEVLASTLTFADTAVAPNSTYYYEVAAVNGSGLEGPRSNQAAVVTGDTPPAAPTGLTAIALGADIVLDWADSGESDLAGYHVYRRVGTSGSYALLASMLTASAFTDTTAVQGTTYFYVVSAVDQGGLESLPSAAASAIVLSTEAGLIGRWELNEGAGTVAADTSGGASHGTLVNGATWTTGVIGGAVSFDGVNDHISTPFNQNLAAWTVGLWVRSPAAPSSAAASGPVQRATNFQINWNHPDATFRGAASLRVEGNWYAARFGTLSANTWYHLVATYDGETLRAYRDGVLVTANASPSGPPAADTGQTFFGRHATRVQFFTGTVDEIRIYQRVLSDSEIAALTAAR